jgi:hypothetical protein
MPLLLLLPVTAAAWGLLLVSKQCMPPACTLPLLTAVLTTSADARPRMLLARSVSSAVCLLLLVVVVAALALLTRRTAAATLLALT